MSQEKIKTIETELYELKMPGKLIGREVVDSIARKVGIVRSVKIQFYPLNIILIIKGMGVEFPVNIKEVEAIGSVIRLANPAKQSEEIDVDEVIRLRQEIKSELKLLYANLK